MGQDSRRGRRMGREGGGRGWEGRRFQKGKKKGMDGKRNGGGGGGGGGGGFKKGKGWGNGEGEKSNTPITILNSPPASTAEMTLC